jgi:uncharacterized protein
VQAESRWQHGALALALTAVIFLTTAAAARDSRVADAAQKRDRAAVESLLNQHADVNSRQADGATALAWAAHWDDLDLADLLLHAGAQANTANDFGVTPLLLACENGASRMIAKLLAAGADPNTANATGETPLMTASRTGSVEAVRALLSHGAGVNANSNAAGQSALMWAVSERHAEVVRQLIEAKADVRARSKGGFTPLLFAAREGDVESARLLLAAGADANDSLPDGTSALILASASGREAIAKFLLEHGVDPNASRVGYTALHAAVPKGELDLVTALLSHGANPNARLSAAPPAIFGPTGGAGSEVGSGALLLPSGRGDAVPTARGEAGRGRAMRSSLSGATPFWLAAKYVNVPIMRALLAGGADPSLTIEDGTTPLMAAAGLTQFEGPRSKRGDVSQFRSNWDEDDALETVRLLMELGADVNDANQLGQTALHGAAYLAANRLVRLLVERRAELNRQDQRGQTPFRVAEAHLNVSGQGVTHNPETAELLKQLGADMRLGVNGEELLRQLQREAATRSSAPQ